MADRPHEKGLFAKVKLRAVNLGAYSEDVATGEEAERMLKRIRLGASNKQVVECVDPPTSWTDKPGSMDNIGPFVMHLSSVEADNADCTPSVRYINDHRLSGQPALQANTHISRKGDFIVTAAEAGDELLCSYGNGFNPSARVPKVASEGAPRPGVPKVASRSKKASKAPAAPCVRDVMSKQQCMGHASTFYTEWLKRKRDYPEPSEKEIKAWVDMMRHRLAEYRAIGIHLRTALDVRLAQEGKAPKLTTRGKAASPAPTGATNSTLKRAQVALGWCRGADAQISAAEAVGERVRRVVRNDLDTGKLKTAGAYRDNYKHTAQKQTTPIEPPELMKLIKQIITDEVRDDLGLPDTTNGRVFIHIGAGSAPLLHSAKRHGITAINIEKDHKQWHTNTGTPTHTLEVGPEGEMFVLLADKFNFDVGEIAGVLISLDCATNCRITAINKVHGTRHRDIHDAPLTPRAKSEEELTIYVRDETLKLVSSSAIRGKVIMYAFEHGKATCFRDVFLPTIGSKPKYTTTDLRFNEPKLLNWWDYGTPMSKLTHLFTNYSKLWHHAPSAPKLNVAVVVNTAAEGEMRKTLPKVQGLTVQESKAAWPPMFVDSMLSQWVGVHRLRIESAYTGYSGQTPVSQTVASAVDSHRCAALSAQRNRIAAHGYPWRTIAAPDEPMKPTTTVWSARNCTTGVARPHDGEENDAYLESVMRDAWIIHDRKHGWVWAHENYGDVMWDSVHGEIRVLLSPWYDDVHPETNHSQPGAHTLTYSETQLHALKVTKMKEVLSTKVLNRGFKEGAAQGHTTGHTHRCTPSKRCVNCKLACSSASGRNSCGGTFYRITYSDKYEEDLTAQEVWRTIVRSDAPPGFLLHLRNFEHKSQGPPSHDERTLEQWEEDMECEQAEKCFL
jgi:hypothetical protein